LLVQILGTGCGRRLSARPAYLLDILMYIKNTSSRAIIIKITHTIDPTIKRDISAKGLSPWLLIMSPSAVVPKIIAKTMIVG
jgi:hypothetical protein